MNKWRILGKSLENCSITELNWDGASGRFTLERFNDYAIWSLSGVAAKGMGQC